MHWLYDWNQWNTFSFTRQVALLCFPFWPLFPQLWCYLSVAVWAFILSRSVVSDSLKPPGLQPARLLRPWDFPSTNTGAGCHFLFQEILLTQGLNLRLLRCRRVLYRWVPWEAPFESEHHLSSAKDTNQGYCTAQDIISEQFPGLSLPRLCNGVLGIEFAIIF